MHNIQRVGILANPVSTNARLLQKAETELRGHGYAVDTAPTSPHEADSFETLLELNRSHDALVIASGDGTVRNLASLVLKHDIELKPLHIFGAGNANDLANSLHGNAPSIASVLRDGSVHDFRPLFAHVKSPDDSQISLLTLSYFGLGVSAKVVHDINRSRGNFLRKHPTIRHYADGALAVGRIIAGSTFSAQVAGATPRNDYIGLDYIRSPHYLRTRHAGASLEDTEHVKVMELTRHNVSIGGLRAIGRGQFGEVVPVSSVHISELSGPRGHIKAQSDGEVILIQEGSSVELESSPQALPLLVLPHQTTA